MTYGDICVALFVGLLIVGMFIIPFLEHLRNKHLDAIRDEEDALWLKFENEKPRYKIRVSVGDYNTSSLPFEPTVEPSIYNHRRTYRVTSKEAAEESARTIVNGGPYMDYSGNWYPHHQITKVEIGVIK